MFAPQIKNLISVVRTLRPRSVETAQFFHRRGFPVVLPGAPALLSRFRGTDKTGTAPDNITPRHRESCFPAESIVNSMNLPCAKPACGARLPHIHWLPPAPPRSDFSAGIALR